MATDIRHVRGSKVGVAADGSNVFTYVGCVFGMAMPPLMRGTADVTCLNPVSLDFYREFIKGFKDGGEPTFKFRFGAAAYTLMKIIFEDDDCVIIPRWQFVFGGCPADPIHFFKFFGIITGLDMPEKTSDGDNSWEANVKIKISGKPGFYTGGVLAA